MLTEKMLIRKGFEKYATFITAIF